MLMPHRWIALIIGVLMLVPPPVEAELIAHLPLDADFKDHSGHGYDGIPSGNVRLVDGASVGRAGNVAIFGGNGDWIVLPHIPLDNRPFAFAFWLKAGKYPQYGLVEQGMVNAPGQLLHLQLRDLRQPRMSFLSGGLRTPVAEALDEEWHHLVFQYNGVKQQIWKDGKLIGEQDSPAYQGKIGLTIIGKTPVWANVPTTDLEGYVSDFRLYDQPLAESEIKNLLKMSLPATRPVVDEVKKDAAARFEKPGVATEVLLSADHFVVSVYRSIWIRYIPR